MGFLRPEEAQKFAPYLRPPLLLPWVRDGLFTPRVRRVRTSGERSLQLLVVQTNEFQESCCLEPGAAEEEREGLWCPGPPPSPHHRKGGGRAGPGPCWVINRRLTIPFPTYFPLQGDAGESMTSLRWPSVHGTFGCSIEGSVKEEGEGKKPHSVRKREADMFT